VSLQRLPTSLVAERAVRLLRDLGESLTSRELARQILAATTADETVATRVLEAAFSGDPRLTYAEGQWRVSPSARAVPSRKAKQPVALSDRALIHVRGERLPGGPFRLISISALRLHDDEVVSACGGDAIAGRGGNRLRRAIRETLDGAIPVIHDPPGALRAVEDWLEEPLLAPISLRRLGRERAGLPAGHDLETLVGHLGLPWRETDDPLELADILDACLRSLCEPGELLESLRGTGRENRLDWSRFAFDREFLAKIPSVPGTYRFFGPGGELVYVGKSKNLNRRIGSYFREDGVKRSARTAKIVDAVHRIEYEPAGSDLEAVLREAEAIRNERPAANIQRQVHEREGRAKRLRSILILEPAASPFVLRAFLIRNGRMAGRVPIGPRGGGLKRVERILRDRFFETPAGPTSVSGHDLDVEVVVRWLSAHRDRVVAFDPTDLASPEEVVERLRWFLGHGSPFDSDGAPILSR